MTDGRLVSRQEGDIMLGALFPIHTSGSSVDGCGALQVIFHLSSLQPHGYSERIYAIPTPALFTYPSSLLLFHTDQI